MGGYHATIRRKTGNYIGVNSKLKLPDKCISVPDNNGNNGILPEFVHGFYKGAYGIDAGLVYNRDGDKKWRLFHNSLYANSVPNTLDPGWDQSSSFSLTLGSTVQLATYIDMTTKEFVTTVKNLSGSTISSLRTSIKSAAFTKLKNGADITRELLMATNRTNNIIPSNAVFEFAKFYNGTLTTVSGQYVPMVGTAEAAHADDSLQFENKRIRNLCVNETYSGTIYSCEVGSCNFNSVVNWEYTW